MTGLNALIDVVMGREVVHENGICLPSKSVRIINWVFGEETEVPNTSDAVVRSKVVK